MWRGGRMWVINAFEGGPTIHFKVTQMLTGNLTFRTFSKSRWLSVASSCRYLVLSLLFGLKHFVDWRRPHSI